MTGTRRPPSHAMSRRAFGGTIAAAALALMGSNRPSAASSPRLDEMAIGGKRIALTARVATVDILPGRTTADAWLLAPQPFPALRLTQGETLDVTLRNRLPQHTSIHWHGVRLPNAMDGVPYLTQKPVQPGNEFHYSFVPPDAGIYFFHPHCNSTEQIGRGLLGVLIVDEAQKQRFDEDLVLVLKDWRLDADANFSSFSTLKGASRAGTFGTVRTVNARPCPRFEVPADSHMRLRIVNADSTRICAIGIDGGSASVIAIDGNRVKPFPLVTWRIGPGMRLELALRTPRDGAVRLLDYFAAEPVALASFSPRDNPIVSVARLPGDLPKGALSRPDLARAWSHTLQLGAGVTPLDVPDPPAVLLADGTRFELVDALCLAGESLWTLDGQAWPLRDHHRLPPPLFTLARGQTVLLELENTTSHAHPIHIHGHTMTVLSATILQRPVHDADTVLVMPNERVTVAFAADNPGSWMIHCHIIEHQETGMMGWFRVS